MPKLILFNKPFGVLSQFRTDDNNNFATLSEYFSDKSLRVAGRLDATSEGLLLLTDNGQINQALTAPPAVLKKHNIDKVHGKTYWVQLEGQATAEQIEQLRQGVWLKDGLTLPAKVELLNEHQVQQNIWQAPDGIAKRKITTWLSITIVEGKNRQVRRMTAHVGLPCLRLIRIASSGFELGHLAVGEYRQILLNNQQLQQLGMTQANFAKKNTPNLPKNLRRK